MRHGLEVTGRNGKRYADFDGAIADVHTHPRIFDVRLDGQPEILNGKAGIGLYSEVALKNGITIMVAMPNESVRLYNPAHPDQTELFPYPITTADRVLAAANVVTNNTLIPTGLFMGVDRDILGLGNTEESPHFTTKNIEREFSSPIVQKLTWGLKIYGSETTGGYNIPLDRIIPVGEVYNKHNPGKPIILHLEDEDVGKVLAEWPAGIPVHIAHVSSRQELEAVILAKQAGKDVTCEATPHHLFLTEETRQVIGPNGCVKPSLKPDTDRQFLWDNLKYIDIFASDCAPHRHIDKVGIDGKGLEKPAYGIANHDVFLRLFLTALEDGWITEQQLFERIVTNPAKRFNLPRMNSSTSVSLSPITAKEAVANTPYGCSPFAESSESPLMIGRVDNVRIAGKLAVKSQVLTNPTASYTNLLRT